MKIVVRLHTVLRLQDMNWIRKYVNAYPYRCESISNPVAGLGTFCNMFTYACNMLSRLKYDQNEVYSKQEQTSRFICQNMQKETF